MTKCKSHLLKTLLNYDYQQCRRGGPGQSATIWELAGPETPTSSRAVLFSSFQAMTSSVIYYSTHALQNDIYLLII